MGSDITRLLSEEETVVRPARGLALYIKDTGSIKGRGVFAGRAFAAGDLVEVAPVIVFTICPIPRAIANVLYNWEQQTKQPNTRAIAMGYGSLYNHDNPANLSYVVDAVQQVIRYSARRSIRIDEELTINYDAAQGVCEPNQEGWFDRQGLRKLKQ